MSQWFVHFLLAIVALIALVLGVVANSRLDVIEKNQAAIREHAQESLK